MSRNELFERACALLTEIDPTRLEAIVWALESLCGGTRRPSADGVDTAADLAASQLHLTMENIERLLALGPDAVIGGAARVARRRPS